MKKTTLYSRLVIGFSIFIAVGAIGGSLSMFIAPEETGMIGLLEGMQKLPFAEIFFQNLVFPGIALLLIIALPNSIVTIMSLKKYKHTSFYSLACGVILMLWIILQFIIYPFNIMSTIFFIIGFAQLNISLALIRALRHEKED